ncbi:MAG: polymer-forming cytoskeletal protein [Chloroflexi bacterium]|nr:polymer-forming cytoskeletal protein [Chloroflexota bacterium]
MRLKKILLGVILIALILSGTFAAAYAFSFSLPTSQTGSVTIDESKVIEDNHFVSGNLIDFSGTAKKDLFLFAATVMYDGKTDGSLFVGGGQVKLDGEINGDIYAFAGNLEIGKAAVINGDIIAFAGTVRVDGKVKGKILAGVGNLILGPGAEVEGKITYYSSEKANVAEGAKIGEISQREPKKEPIQGEVVKTKSPFSILFKPVFLVFSFLTAFFVGIIFILMAPMWAEKVSQEIRSHFWKSLITGFIFLVVVPAISAICFVLIIGIPLALIILVVYFIYVYLATIFAALGLGQWILKNKVHPIWSLGLGLLILLLLRLIPYAGGIFGFIALLVGLGAMYAAKRYYFDKLKTIG